MSKIDYAPFDGDGRHRRACMLHLPGAQGMAVTNAQARAMIDALMASGRSTHSGLGGTLWVLLWWLQSHLVPYTLKARPGGFYYIELGAE